MSDENVIKLPPTNRKYTSGGLTAGFLCPDCSAYVFNTETHDKFHDAYKPSRKASFATMRANGDVVMQLIDGSQITIDADDGKPTIEPDAALALMFEWNTKLAPFYEGGETALVEAQIAWENEETCSTCNKPLRQCVCPF